MHTYDKDMYEDLQHNHDLIFQLFAALFEELNKGS